MIEIKDKKKIIKNSIIWTFTGIPFLSSFISTIHLIDLFKLGNTGWMSWILAIAFEFGSIASLLILTILDKVNKGMVMTIFFVLMGFQVLGNIYYSFDFINTKLQENPNWLGSFQELASYLVMGDLTLMKLLVSVLVGVPIPLISLFFLKALVDYLKVDEPLMISPVQPAEQKTIDVVQPAEQKVEITEPPKFDDIKTKKIINFKPNFDNINANRDVKFDPILDDVSSKRDVNFTPEFGNIKTDANIISEPELKEKNVTKTVIDDTEEPETKKELYTDQDQIEKKDEPQIFDDVINEFETKSKLIEEQYKQKKPLGQSNVSIYQNNNLR